jgi:hypothetical protein
MVTFSTMPYYAVGKIVLLKIADHVLKRQRGNGGFVG